MLTYYGQNGEIEQIEGAVNLRNPASNIAFQRANEPKYAKIRMPLNHINPPIRIIKRVIKCQ